MPKPDITLFTTSSKRRAEIAMKWADKSLDDLATIYWDEIAPDFKADGYDPETEYPSYEWLVANGYRGFRYPFRGAHDAYDMSLAEFFNEYLGLDGNQDTDAYDWPGNDEETHEALDQYLESVSDRVSIQTVRTYRHQLATILRLYCEEYSDCDIISVTAAEPGTVKARWRPVFVRLDATLESEESKNKHVRLLENFYSFFSAPATQPIRDLRAEYEWHENSSSESAELSADQLIRMYNGAAFTKERLLVLLIGLGDLSTGECASLTTSAVRIETDRGVFCVVLDADDERCIPAVPGIRPLQRRLAAHQYVFPSNETGRAHVTSETIRRWFGDAARRAGVSVNGRLPTPRDARRISQSARETLMKWGFSRVESTINGGNDR